METNNSFDVTYVAELARIELNDADKARLQQDMQAIVGYIEQLNEVDVSGIEPTAHAVTLTNVTREDRAGKSVPRETMLANAPATVNDDELIKVPQVLPGEGMA
ncbi:MAG: Asp-tRNA(Asn)/Glu-tRNA(Gln) amidotransferase subunit GatC [Victivallaceae bacterium]|nr:Asp-tRNA(Asn)/Glu-tRNA(Gln) amidotransferase subunit GatC [Victivallaceae bacterium]